MNKKKESPLQKGGNLTKEAYKCSCCGVGYNSRKNNFLSSGSPLFKGNGGYTNMCRSCVDGQYKKLLGFYNGSVELAIEHCCRMFDWYYNDSIVQATGKEAAVSRVLLYPSKLNMVQFKAAGKTYLDTIAENRAKPAVPIAEAVNDTYKASPETIRFFGNGYSNEDYSFLQEQYDDWTSRYECNSKAQEELFKAICVAQLTIQVTQQGIRDVKEIEKAMKTFQDLLKTADLKPNRSAIESGGQETFGMLIKKLESERPVSAPADEWKDVDGINKYIDTWFLGHLANLAKIKNPNEEAYRAEVEKYTVAPPQTDEDR